MQGHLNPEGRISILNVGTKILLKDVMDQYIRTLGDFKTHYASNMASALRAFSENTIHIVITEVSLDDGSAFRLLSQLGGVASELDDLYVIIAVEERSDALMALAAELEAHAVLVKPFAATDLKAQIDRYKGMMAMPKEPWQLLVHEARMSMRDKKFREAESHYMEALKAAPTHPGPYYRAGVHFLQKPDYGIAEGLLKKALTFKPDYTQAMSALGTLYIAKGELDKAEEFLKRAQSISPLNPDRMVEMVKLYVDRCVSICQSTLRMDPGANLSRYHLGKLMAVQKDYIGAVRELEKVLPTLKDSQKAEAQTFIALARKLGGLAR